MLSHRASVLAKSLFRVCDYACHWECVEMLWKKNKKAKVIAIRTTIIKSKTSVAVLMMFTTLSP